MLAGWPQKIAVFLFLFFFGIHASAENNSNFNRYLTNDQMNAVTELLNTIAHNRKYSELMNNNSITHGILKGIISVLDDEFATVIDISGHQGSLHPVSSLYVDCGFSLETDAFGRLLVVSVAPDSPAVDRIKPGDFLLQVDKMNTAGLSCWELMSSIIGPAESSVDIVVQTPGGSPRHVTIKRQEQKVTAVDTRIGSLKFGRWVDDREGRWAWVKVYSYTDPVMRKQWTEAIQRIWSSPTVDGVLLDLRNNGGGDNSCITTLGDFFPRGETLVHFEGLLGDEPWRETIYNYTTPYARLIAYPVVVLVNGRTASLAEIVAATLQEQRDIKLVGQQTFGKGTTQTWLRLNSTYAAHLTLGRWLTPNGVDVNGSGLKPDIRIEDNPRTRHIDEQLVQAIQVLQNR